MTNSARLPLYHTFICRVWGVCIQSCSCLHFWARSLKSCLARPCTRLQGRPCRDSCSLRSCEPKSLFGKRPACLQSHLLGPWGRSRSGSCLRRWHCRTLAPKLSNVPLERQACSLWKPFHLCCSQTSETVLSASILLLYLTSISIRIKGSQSTTSRKTRVRGTGGARPEHFHPFIHRSRAFACAHMLCS